MLYCPKCQATYENGTQRFCTNEGARLLPYSSAEKSDLPSEGVFSSILGKSSAKKEESAIKSEKVKSESAVSAFNPPKKSKFFKSAQSKEDFEESEPTVSDVTEQEKEPARKKTFEHLPLANIIHPNLIPEKQRDTDKIFVNEQQKTEIKSEEPSEIFEFEEEPVLESFENKNEDLLEVDDESEAELSENDDEIQLLDDEISNPFGKSDSSNIELDLAGVDDFPEISEQESELEINFDEPLEEIGEYSSSSDVELDLNDFDKDSVTSDDLPKIELDLDDIEDIPIPTTFSTGVELDLESQKEINLADSIPRIELDLADLEEVEIPAEAETESEPEEMIFGYREPIINFEDEDEESSSSPVLVGSVGDEDNFESLDEKKSEESATPIIATDITREENIKATSDSTWKSDSSESYGEESKWYLFPLIGIILLGLGLIGYFYFTSQNNTNNQGQTNVQTNVESNVQIENSNQVNTNTNSNGIIPEESITPPPFQDGSLYRGEPKSQYGDVPPPPRKIAQPPNTVFYKNEKSDQKGVLADNFLGFSIYFPKDWQEIRSFNKFLDISKKTPEGLPIKQMLITRYDSNGTFEADKTIFDDLVKQSNSDLRKILSNYQVISEGETTIQNGRWKVYEVKFQGIGSDKKLIIWGKRLWMPIQRSGMKSGFIITMIATSLSKDVKSVEDVGVKDDLAEILKTFEPELN